MRREDNLYIANMRKEDKTKLEKMLGKTEDEKLVLARFDYDKKQCFIYPSNYIYYDSWHTIRFEDIFDADDSKFKTIRILKERFPSIRKVFAYYSCLDGGYIVKDQLEEGGWKVINDDVTMVNGEKRITPMYETSCGFIFAVPKKLRLNYERNTEIDGVIVNG